MSTAESAKRAVGRDVRVAGFHLPQTPEPADISDPSKNDVLPRKTCPMCGSRIPAVAICCSHCGEVLGNDPKATNPIDNGPIGLWRDGKRLVMHKLAKLPDRCVKSNRPAFGRNKKYVFKWAHPKFPFLSSLLVIPLVLIVFAVNYVIDLDSVLFADYFGVEGVLLLGVLVSCGVTAVFCVCLTHFLTKTATIYITLTQEWLARRRRRILMASAAMCGLIFAIIYGIANNAQGPVEVALIICGIIGAYVVLTVVTFGTCLMNLVAPKRITNNYIWLKGVHPDYLAALPDWPKHE